MWTESQDTLNIDTNTIFALTLLGEFESGGEMGMDDVASVVLNRVKANQWWGKDIRSVCLWPYQFSCWLPGPDRDRIMAANFNNNSMYQLAIRIALNSSQGGLSDTTNGSTHYFVSTIPEPPKWYLDLIEKIPCHIDQTTWFFDLSKTG